MLSNTIDFPFVLKTVVAADKEIPMRTMQYGPYNETFTCLHCHTSNAFEIEYYKGGYPLEMLYKDHAYISREELLLHKVAQEAYPGYERLGELTLWYVEARYQAKKCTDCNARYLMVYGMGEIQPGREVLQISGIWKIAQTDSE